MNSSDCIVHLAQRESFEKFVQYVELLQIKNIMNTGIIIIWVFRPMIDHSIISSIQFCYTQIIIFLYPIYQIDIDPKRSLQYIHIPQSLHL